MLELSDVKDYMAQIGLALPDALVECLISSVNKKQECLEAAGMDACTIKLAQLNALALLGLNQGARQVRSQSAPSGASQSYAYPTMQEQTRSLIASLRQLGAYNCFADLIPNSQPKGRLVIGLGARA